MDGVKLNEEKYAKPKKEVEKPHPLNDVSEVISVDIPAGTDPTEELERLMNKTKKETPADANEVNSTGSKRSKRKSKQKQEEKLQES